MQCGRQHFALHRQDTPGLSHGFFETAGHVGQGGQQQVAQGMTFQPGAAAEAVLEDLSDQRLVIGQCRQAVADVARWQDAGRAAQFTGRTALIGHGDDGGQVASLGLQTPQQGGQSMPAPQGDDLGSAVALAVIFDLVHDRLTGFHQWAEQCPVETDQAKSHQDQSQPAEDDRPQGAVEETQGKV